MRKWTIPILACWLLGMLTAPGKGVTIFLKGSRQPIRALLVEQDEQKIVVREKLSDGTFRQRQVMRSEIDDVILAVSFEKLEKLDGSNPQAYRDYAEELADKYEDPDARTTAIRLYLIAAHLGSEGLRRSVLLGMASLARSPDEERKFRAMAYLSDPKHDRGLLKQPDQRKPAPQVPPRRPPKALLTALQLLRQGNRKSALKQARGLREQFAQFAGEFSYEEFIEVCKQPTRTPISDGLLRKILQLELALSETADVAEGHAPAGESDTPSWSRVLRLGDHAPVPSLSLETLTEFNPRECHFRNGRWVEP